MEIVAIILAASFFLSLVWVLRFPHHAFSGIESQIAIMNLMARCPVMMLETKAYTIEQYLAHAEWVVKERETQHHPKSLHRAYAYWLDIEEDKADQSFEVFDNGPAITIQHRVVASAYPERQVH